MKLDPIDLIQKPHNLYYKSNMNATAKPRHLVLIAATLRAGGIERILSYWANHWSEQGHRISVILFEDITVPPFFELAPTIKVMSLGAPARPIRATDPLAPWYSLQQIKRLRATLRSVITGEESCLMVSFGTYYNLVALIASIGLSVKKIVSEHHPQTKDTLPLRWLRSFLYLLSDRIVVLTEDAKRATLRWLRPRTRVIPNPIVKPKFAARSAQKLRDTVLAVGRLVVEKRFDLLITAFAQLADEFPTWDLKIAGGGPLQSEFLSEIKRNKLENRIFLTGETSNVDGLYAEASLFVLSSDSEGFPVALGEAMAAALPVLARDCNFGPRDIIHHNVNGWLVEKSSAIALAQSMRLLMGDETLRQRLAHAAPSVCDRFSPSRLSEQWEQLFLTLEKS